MCNCEHCKNAVGRVALADNLHNSANNKAAAIATALKMAAQYERFNINCAAEDYRAAARILKRR